jgi:hypothetical protein
MRVQGLKAAEASELIGSVLAKVEKQLLTGVMISATRNLVRSQAPPHFLTLRCAGPGKINEEG